MIKRREILYSLDDVCIIPAAKSEIEHRNECNPYYDNTLPIFTAPMPTVVDEETYKTYIKNNITPIIPRTVDYDTRMKLFLKEKIFVAFSLQEAEHLFSQMMFQNNIQPAQYRMCIDVANGNMEAVSSLVLRMKTKLEDNIIIMAGNIANRDSFHKLSDAGCDYIRISIGTGSACTTATQTGVYYPMASLIYECSFYKYEHSHCAKIVADGGFTSYRDIMKALALGADYVMLGNMLNRLQDSPGDIIETKDGIKYKLYYGMASAIGREMLNKKEYKLYDRTPEGKIKYNKMSDLTIEKFSKEVKDILQSTMSYCDCKTLKEFTSGKVELGIMSNNASRQYNQNTDNEILNIENVILMD